MRPGRDTRESGRRADPVGERLAGSQPSKPRLSPQVSRGRERDGAARGCSARHTSGASECPEGAALRPEKQGTDIVLRPQTQRGRALPRPVVIRISGRLRLEGIEIQDASSGKALPAVVVQMRLRVRRPCGCVSGARAVACPAPVRLRVRSALDGSEGQGHRADFGQSLRATSSPVLDEIRRFAAGNTKSKRGRADGLAEASRPPRRRGWPARNLLLRPAGGLQ
jgi:hypothetical protein